MEWNEQSAALSISHSINCIEVIQPFAHTQIQSAAHRRARTQTQSVAIQTVCVPSSPLYDTCLNKPPSRSFLLSLQLRIPGVQADEQSFDFTWNPMICN